MQTYNISGKALGRGAFEIAELLESVSNIEVISLSIASDDTFTATVKRKVNPYSDLGFTHDFYFEGYAPPPFMNKVRNERKRRW